MIFTAPEANEYARKQHDEDDEAQQAECEDIKILREERNTQNDELPVDHIEQHQRMSAHMDPGTGEKTQQQNCAEPFTVLVKQAPDNFGVNPDPAACFNIHIAQVLPKIGSVFFRHPGYSFNTLGSMLDQGAGAGAVAVLSACTGAPAFSPWGAFAAGFPALVPCRLNT